MAETLPLKTRSPKASAFNKTSCPFSIFPTVFCGKVKSINIGSIVCIVNNLSPGLTYCPGLIVTIPTLPLKGAFKFFFDTNEVCCRTCACLAFKSAELASKTFWLIARISSCIRSRSLIIFAKSACALSASKKAISAAWVSSTRTSPARTSIPEVTGTARTIPLTSVLNSTPRNARTLPTALS